MAKRRGDVFSRKEHWVRSCLRAHARRLKPGAAAVHGWEEIAEEDLLVMCWACGHHRKTLQRCHIVPKSLGGRLVPSNVVPLCSLCHDQSPDVNDPEEIWKWLRSVQNPWASVGLGRYIGLIELAQSGQGLIQAGPIDKARFQESFAFWLRQCSLHGGQSGQGPYIKNSSLEWALRQTLKAFTADGQLELL